MLFISVPIALQNLISFGLSLMDTVFMGSLGEKQIAASSIANQPFFIFTIFLFGLASGACVLTAQYWGKGDSDAVGRVLAISMRAAVICSVIFGAVAIVIPGAVMALFTTDTEIIDYGAQFLRIIGFSYIIYGISCTYLYILRSVEKVRVPMVIYFISFIVNTVLNVILIYGKFGLPKMGIRGSATANLCARVVELLLAVVYFRCFDGTIKIKARDFLKIDRELLRDFLRYSLPVIINETVWALGNSMQSVVVGHMGGSYVAANSIALVLQRLAMVVIMGVANFSAIMVGKVIGSGDLKKAKSYSNTTLALGVVLGVVSAVFIMAARAPFISIYTVPEQTRALTADIIAVYAVNVLFVSFNYVNIIGVLRSGGDTRFAMIIDVGCLWLIAIPAGAVAGLYWHLPVFAVMLFLTIDEPVKVLLGYARFKSGKWLRNVTR